MSALDYAAREAAIEAQFIARFDAASITHYHNNSDVINVQMIESEVAKVATSFATQYFGVNHRHLATVLTQAKVRRVANDSTLDCSAPTKPTLINSLITDEKGAALALKHAEQKILCAEYYLHTTIVKICVKVITAAFGAEYTEVLDLEDVGFSVETILYMLAHLCSWFTITDANQDAAEDSFCAPWSNFPNTHLSTYARRLTCLQNEAVNVHLIITNTAKLRVLAKAARASGLFTRRFFDTYEDAAADKTWAIQLPLFVSEYTKIMRAAGRADAEAEYESNAALREESHHPTSQLLAPQVAPAAPAEDAPAEAAPAEDARKRYADVIEYAAALKEHI